MYGDLPTICGGNWSSAVLALSTHGCRLARPLSWFAMCVVSASHSIPSMLPVANPNSATLSERPPLVLLRVLAVLLGRQSFPSCKVFNIGNGLCLVRRVVTVALSFFLPLDRSGVNFTKPV